MRAIDIPFVRKSSVVAIKLRAPNKDAMQKRAIDIAHRFWPIASPGPAAPPTALSGAYAVHPEIGGPSATKKDAIITTNDANVVQKDIILNRGKAMSSAPI